MFFFNLTAAEFMVLLSGISSLVVVLYLLDRSRRRQVVATLRFWQQTEVPSQRKHRRKIQHPLSLLMQLAALLLLLLAIAQLRIGAPGASWRNHVLLLDASAWMNTRGPSGPLMQEARLAALRYVRALPSSDRVMLVRADAMPTPVTGFESNRQTLENTIRQLDPGVSALNLAQAFEFASQALSLEGGRAGEIVYAGAARMTSEALGEMPAPPGNLRILPVTRDPQNSGFRRAVITRAPADPELWQVFLTVRNYGRRPRSLPLVAAFGGAPVATRRLTVQPGAEAVASFEFRTKAAGWLQARLETGDALPLDDTVTLELPAEQSVKITVYSADPGLLRPLLAANPRFQTAFRRPGEAVDPNAAILIFDRSSAPAPVSQNAIWIDPPAGASPFTRSGQKQNVTLTWRAGQPLAAGLRTKDARIDSTQVFTPAPADTPIAEAEGSPAILAREGKIRTAVFGFHPMRTPLRYELAAPLVFANVLKWMSPDIFRAVELHAGTVGAVSVPLEAGIDPSSVSAVLDERFQLPFTLRDQTLRFFTGAPGLVRLRLGQRDLVYSLSLPEIAESRWEPPKTVRTGLAGIGGVESIARDLWYWLALAGGLILLLEWILYGRGAALSTAARTRLGRLLPFARRAQPQARKAS